MGLDAVVFRNAEKLAKSYNIKVVDVDRQTGEAQVAGEDLARLPRDALIAIKRRMGNLDDIVELREEAVRILVDPESIITGKVLYSAFHSGDLVGAEEFANLRRELSILESTRNCRLASFVLSMSDVLDVAEAEQNPIVFV